MPELSQEDRLKGIKHELDVAARHVEVALREWSTLQMHDDAWNHVTVADSSLKAALRKLK